METAPGQKSKGTVWDRITKSSTNSNTALSILRSGSKSGKRRRFENRSSTKAVERLHEAYDSKKKNVSINLPTGNPKKIFERNVLELRVNKNMLKACKNR